MTKVYRFKLPLFFADWGIRSLLSIPVISRAHEFFALFSAQPTNLTIVIAIICNLIGFLSLLLEWILCAGLDAAWYYLTSLRFLSLYSAILALTLVGQPIGDDNLEEVL